jgi:hypothetical protein
VVVKKKCFCVFSILIVGKEAVCPDGLFVPAVFRESDFNLNSLTCAQDKDHGIFNPGSHSNGLSLPRN